MIAPEQRLEAIEARLERAEYFVDDARWLASYARDLQAERERLRGRVAALQDELERVERPSPLGRTAAALERLADVLERRRP